MERDASISACASKLGRVLILLGCMSAIHLHADPQNRRSSRGNDNDSASIERYRKWRNTLPLCTSEKSGLREDWPESGKVTRLQGVLKMGSWMCTAKGCSFKCCNSCFSEWKVLSKGDFNKKGPGGKGKYIVLARKTRPLAYYGMDCEAAHLKRLPFLEVVISGKMATEDTVTNATLCVAGEIPRVFRKHADYPVWTP